jgi:tetratricopeptide (TPR) repeat protein
VSRLFYIVAIAVLLTGCAGPLKQGWYDFTAYYNTFYNAKQYFEDGKDLNLRQVPELDPSVPVRIHPAPTQAGHEELEQAIERGASILRNHQESRFVDRAVLLIGQSYFYRQEYFSALEKFQELQAVSTGEKFQKALLWQGRTYLEMSSYNEGIRFLEVEKEYVAEWDPVLLDEVHAVLAQLHVATGNWQTASGYLHLLGENLEDRNHKARAYFLHGQIQERLDNPRQALAAYRLAGTVRADHDITFNILRKQAELNRTVGDYEAALALYDDLSRNDNYIDHRQEMLFEVARTHQLAGNYEEATGRLQSLLTDPIDTPTTETRAKSYFSLGEIHRDQLDNFQTAAAYFDSAAVLSADEDLLPYYMNIDEMAASFGEYAALKRELNHADSLLYLGSLEPEELDSVVARVRTQLIEEQEQQQAREQQRSERMMLSDAPADTLLEAAESTEFGFLNIENRSLVTDASLQFQAVWGDRPLVDNWRRRAAVSGSRFEQMVLSDGETEVEEAPGEDPETTQLPGLDLSEIPSTPAERRQLEEAAENARYRLANLFFLSLDMPDSARAYYRDVIESSLNPEVTSRALYSLSELEFSLGHDEEAARWARRMLEEYPDAEHAERLAARLGEPRPVENLREELPVSSRYRDIVERGEEHPADAARDLRDLADSVTEENLRAMLLFEAATFYIREGQRQPGHQESVEAWEAEPGVHEGFPFEGEYWDEARDLLAQAEEAAPASRYADRAQSIRRSLEKPEPDTVRVADIERMPEDRLPRDPAPEPAICREMGLEPDLEGGYDAFFDLIRYPAWAVEAEFRGEVTYRLNISDEGEVTSYELRSNIDRTGIPQAIEEAIELELRFHPPEHGRAQCDLMIPIDL